MEGLLKSMNVSSLTQFNDITIGFMFNDKIIADHLISEVKRVTTKCAEPNNNNAMVKEIKIPELFKCRITNKIMKDPVTAFDGYFYERSAIENYLKINNKSPVTGANADIIIVFPSHRLKAEIQKYIKENNIVLD